MAGLTGSPAVYIFVVCGLILQRYVAGTGEAHVAPCNQRNETFCLEKVKDILTRDDWWFGKHYSQTCPESRRLTEYKCFNRAPNLTTIIERALQRSDVDLDAIQQILKIRYNVPAGRYHACGRRWSVPSFYMSSDVDPTHIYTDISQWTLSHRPAVTWTHRPDRWYALVVSDVGDVQLCGMWVNIPGGDAAFGQEILPYIGPTTALDRPNFFLFTLFEYQQPMTFAHIEDMRTAIRSIPYKDGGLFNIHEVPQLLNLTRNDPIAVGVLGVGPDAYGIGQLYQRDVINNCPSLIQKSRPELEELVDTFNLRSKTSIQLDVNVEVEFYTEEFNYTSCCIHKHQKSSVIKVNPIEATLIPPVYLRNRPYIQLSPVNMQDKTFNTDNLFTVLLVDMSGIKQNNTRHGSDKVEKSSTRFTNTNQTALTNTISVNYTEQFNENSSNTGDISLLPTITPNSSIADNNSNVNNTNFNDDDNIDNSTYYTYNLSISYNNNNTNNSSSNNNKTYSHNDNIENGSYFNNDTSTNVNNSTNNNTTNNNNANNTSLNNYNTYNHKNSSTNNNNTYNHNDNIDNGTYFNNDTSINYYNSTIDNSNIDNNTIDNSTIDNSTIDNSTRNNSTSNNSTIDNSTIDNSTSNNSTNNTSSTRTTSATTNTTSTVTLLWYSSDIWRPFPSGRDPYLSQVIRDYTMPLPHLGHINEGERLYAILAFKQKQGIMGNIKLDDYCFYDNGNHLKICNLDLTSLYNDLQLQLSGVTFFRSEPDMYSRMVMYETNMTSMDEACSTVSCFKYPCADITVPPTSSSEQTTVTPALSDTVGTDPPQPQDHTIQPTTHPTHTDTDQTDQTTLPTRNVPDVEDSTARTANPSSIPSQSSGNIQIKENSQTLRIVATTFSIVVISLYGEIS